MAWQLTRYPYRTEKKAENRVYNRGCFRSKYGFNQLLILALYLNLIYL